MEARLFVRDLGEMACHTQGVPWLHELFALELLVADPALHSYAAFVVEPSAAQDAEGIQMAAQRAGFVWRHSTVVHRASVVFVYQPGRYDHLLAALQGVAVHRVWLSCSFPLLAARTLMHTAAKETCLAVEQAGDVGCTRRAADRWLQALEAIRLAQRESAFISRHHFMACVLRASMHAGHMLRLGGHYDMATHTLQTAITHLASFAHGDCRPICALALTNFELGNVLADQGRMSAAVDAYQSAQTVFECDAHISENGTSSLEMNGLCLLGIYAAHKKAGAKEEATKSYGVLRKFLDAYRVPSSKPSKYLELIDSLLGVLSIDGQVSLPGPHPEDCQHIFD